MRVGRVRLAPVLVAAVAGLCSMVSLTGAAGVQEAGGDALAILRDEGAVIFGTSCVSCHDADGGDGPAPALSGHPSMGARDHIVRQILRGNVEKGMPAFAEQLNDRQIAAVATYIRNAWENAHGVVLEADAKKVRDEAKGN
jgi:mono/diheme cytochrome c family protein